jgi:hypothetical protein
MAEMKICPKCLYEYYPLIETCANCGGGLLFSEEHARQEEEKRRCMEKDLADPVVVREGDLTWIDELCKVLIASGITCRVLTEDGCGKSCRGPACRLVVSRENAMKAHERIEEYFAEVHPEAKASQELMEQGKCPACGSDTGPSDTECRDCGLTLLIVE